MKTNASLLRHLTAVAAFSALTLTGAQAQTTATTVPVGFTTVTVPASPDGVAPGNVAMSIPLYQTADFSGTVASIDGPQSFTLTGANFAFNALTDTHNPRLVRIKAGANVGLYFNKIDSNTATQLTVSGTVTGLLNVGDTIEVLPANTIGKVFGSVQLVNAGVPGAFAPLLQTGTSATAVGTDNIYILKNKIWATYYNNGTSWKGTSGLKTFDDDVIPPDAGMFVVHYGLAPVTITLSGTVPSTTEETVFAGGGSTFIANRFPADTTFNSLLGGATGTASLVFADWVIGPAGDSVFAWNSTGGKWDTYYYDGTNWKKSSALGNHGTDVIPACTAVVVSRSSATGVAISQPLPYTLN